MRPLGYPQTPVEQKSRPSLIKKRVLDGRLDFGILCHGILNAIRFVCRLLKPRDLKEVQPEDIYETETQTHWRDSGTHRSSLSKGSLSPTDKLTHINVLRNVSHLIATVDLKFTKDTSSSRCQAPEPWLSENYRWSGLLDADPPMVFLKAFFCSRA